MDVDHQVDHQVGQKVPLPQSIVALRLCPGLPACLRPPQALTPSKSPLPALSGALLSPWSVRSGGWQRNDLEVQHSALSLAPNCQ